MMSAEDEGGNEEGGPSTAAEGVEAERVEGGTEAEGGNEGGTEAEGMNEGEPSTEDVNEGAEGKEGLSATEGGDDGGKKEEPEFEGLSTAEGEEVLKAGQELEPKIEVGVSVCQLCSYKGAGSHSLAECLHRPNRMHIITHPPSYTVHASVISHFRTHAKAHTRTIIQATDPFFSPMSMQLSAGHDLAELREYQLHASEVRHRDVYLSLSGLYLHKDIHGCSHAPILHTQNKQTHSDVCTLTSAHSQAMWSYLPTAEVAVSDRPKRSFAGAGGLSVKRIQSLRRRREGGKNHVSKDVSGASVLFEGWKESTHVYACIIARRARMGE